MSPRRHASSRPLLGLMLALMLLAVHPSAADPTPPVPGGGTLNQLIQQLHGKLSAALAGRQLARADLALALRRGGKQGLPPRLLRVLGDLLLGRLQAGAVKPRSVARLPTGGGADARQRARAGGYELLLELEASINEGHLHLQGKLLATDRHLWRDMLQPQRGALGHLHARVRLDAEVRAFISSGRTGPLRYTPRSFPLQQGPVLALATGDLDGEGRTEVIALFAEQLVVLKPRGPLAPEPMVTLELPPPVASLRPRRAMGALVAADLDGDGRSELLVRSSETQRGVELTLARGNANLEVKGQLAGYPVAAWRGASGAQRILAVALPGRDQLDGTKLMAALSRTGVAGAAAPQPPAPPMARLPASLYASKVVQVARKQGGPLRFLGAVSINGRLHLVQRGAGQLAAVARQVGLAFDLADMDDDGQLEVATTGVDGPNGDDRITIRRLTGGKLSRPLWQSQRLGGVVTAISHGDLDGDGELELVAALQTRRGKSHLVVLD